MTDSILHADRASEYLPISEYAIVGDSRVAALVARDGSIDWFCWPRFDRPSVFGRILDAHKGGYFQICPTGEFTASRAYVGPTNVLATTFVTAHGKARLTDFLPVRHLQGTASKTAPADPVLIRIVEGLAGEVEIEARFSPAFDYAGTQTEVAAGSTGVVGRGGGVTAKLVAPFSLEKAGPSQARGRTTVGQGQRLVLVLALATGDAEPTVPEDVQKELESTLEFWRNWAASCDYRGPYRDQVLRSALVLKLLVFDPSGAVVAAPTTSLPEEPGGVRNWDYRYTWLRDSALILEALETSGYTQEARRFFEWLCPIWMNNHHDLRIMYRIDGGPVPPERSLTYLDGYLHSRPVRIGNGAALQTQLDVYGEVLEAAHYAYFRHGSPSPEVWQVLRSLAEQAAQHWQDQDRGIWEVRGEPRRFLYSGVLCWVALERAIDLARTFHLPADLQGWAKTRDAIKREVIVRGYNPHIGAFTQYLGGTTLDASVLVIPIVGFLSATDPRVLSTIKAIRERLTWHGLLRRYSAADGLPPGEAAFAMCSFWLVDNLALAGRVDEAKEEYERIIAYANDVGLLSEEIDPMHRRLLGNFPQGFSHLALVRSAYYIARAEVFGAEHRPTRRSQRTAEAKQAGDTGAPKG